MSAAAPSRARSRVWSSSAALAMRANAATTSTKTGSLIRNGCIGSEESRFLRTFPLMSPIRSKCVNNGSSDGRSVALLLSFSQQAPQDFGQHLGQVFGDQTRAKGL